MKKVILLCKCLGILALVAMTQVAFAQKQSGGGNIAPTPSSPNDPNTTFVSSSVALTRIDAKIYELLGVQKANGNPSSIAFQEAELRRTYYNYVKTFIQMGTPVAQSIHLATDKIANGQLTTDRQLMGTIVQEAYTLLH